MYTNKLSFTKNLFKVLGALLLMFSLFACEVVDDQLALSEELEKLTVVYASGDSASSVTRNINLPTTLGELTVEWRSDLVSVISNAGVVTRQFSDVEVKLTATVTSGGLTASRVFTLTVIGVDVNAALDSIILVGNNITFNTATNRYTIVGDITLPQTANGLTITWESSAPNRLSNTGVVVRPAFGQSDATFVLTASINNVEKEFSITVPSIKERPVSLILDDAKAVLLIANVGDGVSQNIVLPTTVTVVSGTDTYTVSVTWVASNTALISNLGVVNRPEENTNVTLTATLSYSGETTTKTFDLVVLAATDTVLVDNIAEAIAISKDGNAVVKNYVRINGVTVIGITGDGVVLADASGILFAYIGSRLSTVVVGETYDVRGLTDRFFGSWQLSNSVATGQPVTFSDSDATPYFPTPVEIGSVTEMMANHQIPSAENPNINYVYYRLTAKVRVQNASDNYGTVFVNSDYAGGDIQTAANTPHSTDGVIVYYHSNKAAFNAFNGLTVTFNVLFYGYRNDRNIFSTLFIETVDDIVTTLDDQGIVNIVETTLKDSFASEYIAATTVNLPASLLGASIAYSSSNEAIVNPQTGVITLPQTGQVEVTLTAVITKGDVTKTVNILLVVGELQTISIKDALALPINAKVKVEGVVTGLIANNTFAIQDSTGAISVFVFNTTNRDAWLPYVGKTVALIGTRTAFGGLQQISFVSAVVGAETPLPLPVNIDDVALTAVALLPYQAQRVTRTNLVVDSLPTQSFGNVLAVLRDPVTNEKIDFFWDARIVVPNGNIGTLVVGDVISLIGVPLTWTSNLPRLAYTNASQIFMGIYYETDESKANAVANGFLIPQEIEDATTLTLPLVGAFDSTVVWASSNATAINSQTGVVTLPATGNVSVTLTATVKVGTTEVVKEYVVVVGEIVRNVSYARSAAVGTILTIEATITVVQFDSREATLDQAVVFVQDSTGGIYLQKVPAIYKNLLVVGNTIRIRGNRTVFNDLVQLNNFVSIEVIATAVNIEPTNVTKPSELFNTQGQLVSVKGYLRQAYTGTPSDYFLVTTEGTFALRLASSADIPQAERTLIINKLVGVPAGTEVTVIAGVGRFQANAQVMLFNANQITIGELGTNAELGAVALALFNAPAANDALTANLTLPVAGLFGSTVEWSSSNTAVISNAGVVTRPLASEANVTVTLTYTIKVGETVAGTGTVVYTVLAEEPVAGKTLLYQFDFATGHSTTYQNPEASVDFTNLVDASLVSTKIYRVAANSVAIVDQVTSRGLVISPRLGGTDLGISYVIFDFGTAIINELEFETYFWNSLAEPLFTKYELHVWNSVTEEWVVVKNLLTEIAGTLIVKKIVVDGLEGSSFRFYSEGGQTGGNNARVLLDNVKAYNIEAPSAVETIETFETNIGISYVNGTFTGVNSVVWTYVHARNQDTFGVEGSGVMLRRGDEPSSISATITGGISSFSFDTRKAFTGDLDRILKITITDENNVELFTMTTSALAFGSGGSTVIIPVSKDGLNITGTFTIKIEVVGTGNRQIVIDNFKWLSN
jgi:hypothetical protein